MEMHDDSEWSLARFLRGIIVIMVNLNLIEFYTILDDMECLKFTYEALLDEELKIYRVRNAPLTRVRMPHIPICDHSEVRGYASPNISAYFQSEFFFPYKPMRVIRETRGHFIKLFFVINNKNVNGWPLTFLLLITKKALWNTPGLVVTIFTFSSISWQRKERDS